MNADNPSGHSAVINGGVTTNVLSANEQWERTAVAAFFIAESRGFEPGFEWDDWFAAERQLGKIVPSAAANVTTSGFVASTAVPGGGKKMPARGARKTAAKSAVASAEASKRKATSGRKTPARARKTKPGIEEQLGGMAS